MGIGRILFVELLGGIGDLVLALPAIQAIGRSHPTADLTVLTFAPGEALLQANPWVHQVIVAQPGAARRSLEHLLNQAAFDLIISDTNYDGIADLITATAAATVTNLWRSPPATERVSDRFLHLLLAEGVITPTAIAPQEPLIHLQPSERAIAQQQLGAAFRPLVFLIPDAGMPVKRWLVDHWIAVGQALQQEFGATIVVPVGADQSQVTHIVTTIGGTARIWELGSLRSLTAAIAQADLVIAPDTGLAHIAAAQQIPTITLFGASWHERYGHAAPHINLQGYPDCPDRNPQNFTEQTCWDNACPVDRWHSCLADISPAAVLQAANSLLQRASSQTTSSQTTSSQATSSHTKKSTHLPPDSTQSTLENSACPLPPAPSFQNLLVLRLDNIGDVIMTTPVLRSLRANLSDARITLMASPAGAGVAPLLPWIDEVLTWRTVWQDLGKLEFDPAREWELIQTLRDRHFDAALILTSFSQSPHPAALICALAGIPIRIGESKETDLGTLTHALPPASDDIHQVDRNLRLLEFIGFAVSDRRLALSPQPASQISLPPYLLLNPWTTCPSRNYAPDRFAIAAMRLSAITGLAIVVTGVAKDRDRALPLLEMLGTGAIDLVGKTTLSELVALVATARLVLTNNTSTMHITDAMETPSVILFAGTEQECQWRPRFSPTRLLRRPTVCSPCYAFTCPYNLECLEIAPEVVVAAGLELLGLAASPHSAPSFH